MKIEFTSGTEAKAVIAFVGQADGQAAMSPPAQKLDRACKSRLSKAVAAAKFNGGAGKVLTVHAPSDTLDVVVLVGVGDLAKVDGAVLERAAASGAKALLTSGIEVASVALAGWKKVANAAHAARIGFGAALAAYRFDTYRTQLKAEQKPSLKTLSIDVPEGGDDWAAHQAVVDANPINEAKFKDVPFEFPKPDTEAVDHAVCGSVLGEDEIPVATHAEPATRPGGRG